MKISIAFLLVWIAAFVSCEAQVLDDSIKIDGHDRSFHFFKPTGKRSSLVFVLHGSGGTGKGAMKGAEKLEVISQQEGALLVYPDGYKNFWNECRKAATSAANIENIDDNTFFEQMIDYFVKNYQVNPNQVFVVGTSGGGHMAYKLALTAPKKFKAITAIIANLPDTSNLDCPEMKLPISVMIINGTADATNPYNGGDMSIPGTQLGRVRSTDRTFSYWATLDGYSGEPVKSSLPDTDPSDGKTIERFAYQKKGKPSVILLKVNGGKHDYPNDINVYLEAWSFFKQEMGK